MGKANQPINKQAYDLLVSLLNVKGVPIFKNSIIIVAICLVILIIALYWFFGTELGCSMRATGCNQSMARAQGIDTKFNIVLSLMISNGIVAFGSVSGIRRYQHGTWCYRNRSCCCYHRWCCF